MRILKYLSITIGTIFGTLLLVAAYYIAPYWNRLPSSAEIHRQSDATNLRMDALPEHVHLALLAAENSDYLASSAGPINCALRALIFDNRPSFCKTPVSRLTRWRVIYEQPYAFRKMRLQDFLLNIKLENQLTHDDILKLALDRAYFGPNAFGITEATNLYFSKAPTELTLAEAATLSGMVKSPTRYNPIQSPERTRLRRNEVLRTMVKRQMITDTEGAIATALPLGAKP